MSEEIKVQKCRLCEFPLSDRFWEDGGFFGGICPIIKKPFIATIDHKQYLTAKEKKHFMYIARKYYNYLLPVNLNHDRCTYHWHKLFF